MLGLPIGRPLPNQHVSRRAAADSRIGAVSHWPEELSLLTNPKAGSVVEIEVMFC